MFLTFFTADSIRNRSFLFFSCPAEKVHDFFMWIRFCRFWLIFKLPNSDFGPHLFWLWPQRLFMILVRIRTCTVCWSRQSGPKAWRKKQVWIGSDRTFCDFIVIFLISISLQLKYLIGGLTSLCSSKLQNVLALLLEWAELTPVHLVFLIFNVICLLDLCLRSL